MKVFFTAATTDDGAFVPQQRTIVSQIKKYKHSITSGEQIVNPHQLARDLSRVPKEIFQREKKAIDEADCVVAEVTKPSSGVGGELVYALLQDKPVLALFYKDAENTLSTMISGNPSEHMYLEHYDEDSLPIVLKRFFEEVAVQKTRVGKLIVVDGGDGSGKTTQSEMLENYLTTRGIPVKSFDFPRYYSSFHGRIVGRFMAGEFGKLNDVSPYLASLAYALDRASTKEEMDTWLARGGTIICNRYATSNMAHQGARLQEEKRKDFLDWIDELEYKVHKIPREDIVVYLHVPWQIALELTKKKGFRAYIGKGPDIAEADLYHRQEAEKMYLALAKKRRHWVVVECVENGAILSKEAIHRRLLEALRKRNLIP